MNFKNITLLLCLFTVFACYNTGEEGKWNKFTFKAGDSKEVYTDVIIVHGSYYASGSGVTNGNIVRVEWQAKNNSKSPSVYNYINKYLIDKSGRKYMPFEGVESEVIQPLAKSKILVCFYEIPTVVKIIDLSWGLYHQDINKVRYKIKLRPEKKQLSEIIN